MKANVKGIIPSWIIYFCSSLQPPAHAGSSLADFSTLKMEAIRSSKTSVHTRSTQRHISEDGILHSHHRENLKSYISVKLLCFIFKCLNLEIRITLRYTEYSIW
jgi:hypothetical protein